MHRIHCSPPAAPDRAVTHLQTPCPSWGLVPPPGGLRRGRLVGQTEPHGVAVRLEAELTTGHLVCSTCPDLPRPLPAAPLVGAVAWDEVPRLSLGHGAYSDLDPSPCPLVVMGQRSVKKSSCDLPACQTSLSCFCCSESGPEGDLVLYMTAGRLAQEIEKVMGSSGASSSQGLSLRSGGDEASESQDP